MKKLHEGKQYKYITFYILKLSSNNNNLLIDNKMK